LNKYNGIPIYNEFIFSMDKCWKGAYNDTISVKAGDYRMDSCGTVSLKFKMKNNLKHKTGLGATELTG